MLTELSLNCFKSWRSIDRMRLAPITGLFGSNSSGKTSILQLLLMLKQTVESPDRVQALIFGDEKTPVNLGTFQDIVLGHLLPGEVSWCVGWRIPPGEKAFVIGDPADRSRELFRGRDIQFAAEVEGENGRLSVVEMSYRFAGAQFGMRRKNQASGGPKYELYSKSESFTFHKARGRHWPLDPPVKCYGFPDQVKAYFTNAGFLADFQFEFEKQLGRTYYLGPLRDYPKRQYTWAGAQPADMGARGERVVDALLAARDRGDSIGLGKGKRRLMLEVYVAEWLKRLGLIHAMSVEAVSKGSNLYRVLVQKSSTSAKVLLTDVGFGVSQILPVIVLCYYVPEGSTILLEQPEIHLHPSVQAGLADVFIDAVKRRKVQIILESHSEHLLRRLQRRMAEDQVKPDDCALYFCQMSDGESKMTKLRTDAFGNIENWPKDFFGDAFGEMAAMTRAAIARQAESQE